MRQGGRSDSLIGWARCRRGAEAEGRCDIRGQCGRDVPPVGQRGRAHALLTSHLAVYRSQKLEVADEGAAFPATSAASATVLLDMYGLVEPGVGGGTCGTDLDPEGSDGEEGGPGSPSACFEGLAITLIQHLASNEGGQDHGAAPKVCARRRDGMGGWERPAAPKAHLLS